MGTWFLGWGQSSIVLPLLLTGAALVSLAPEPFSRYLRVNRIVANFGALVAVAWSLRDFFQRGSEDQLLAIADMLICLQIVLLFQDRTNRVYWQLLVLSVLQVVVAAAMNLGPQFGVLLACYMAVSISTLVLLCMHGEKRHVPSTSPNSSRTTGSAWKELLAPAQVLPATNRESQPLSIRRIFARQVGMLTGATFLFTVVFFYATPRLGDGAWLGSRGGGMSTTGFSSDLVLEEFGSIKQSNQLVMRVHFSRNIERRPYPLIDEPYYHGIVLTEYRNGPEGSRWIAPLTPRYRYDYSQHINQPGSALSLVRQDIALENPNSPILFAVMPVHPLTGTPTDLRYLRRSHRLTRRTEDDSSTQREYRYVLGTMAFRDGRQLHAVPHPNALREPWDRVLLSDELTSLSEFDAEEFPEIAKLAKQILEEQNLTDAPRIEKIMALRNHFHTPGLYKYSLNLNFVRHRDLDPIEDFVANHRTGHCEYFASALALMLRSQGIPSRIITGYHGGELNSLGSYYQVRQKHAHAWVEAYLSAEDTPPEEVAGLPSAGGSWYRLDPTPSSNRPLALKEPTIGDRVGDAFDYVDLLWRDYVLGLNSTRQRDTFYDPLTNKTAGSLPSWMEVNRVQSLVRRWKPGGRGDRESSGGIGGAAIAASVIGSFLVAALVFGGRGLYVFLRDRKMLAWLSRRNGQDGDRSMVAFYARLEALLARLNLHRRPEETPLEFAQQAAASLTQLAAQLPPYALRGELPQLPARIVRAYYQVRFGGARLEQREMEAIERDLADLVVAMNLRPQSSH